MQVSSRNFLLFRMAKATASSHGHEVVVKGLRFPFTRGRYSIMIENIWYGDVPLPKETGEMIEAVRERLGDQRTPKKVPVRQTPG